MKRLGPGGATPPTGRGRCRRRLEPKGPASPRRRQRPVPLRGGGGRGAVESARTAAELQRADTLQLTDDEDDTPDDTPDADDEDTYAQEMEPASTTEDSGCESESG